MSPFYKKSDSDIAEAVLSALRQHTSVPNENIRVKVEDGAEMAAYSAPGVFQIDNRITIDTPEYSFEE